VFQENNFGDEKMKFLLFGAWSRECWHRHFLNRPCRRNKYLGSDSLGGKNNAVEWMWEEMCMEDMVGVSC
jgi:hypothetical protein